MRLCSQGVEQAIETDETIATDWMNQQLEALDINLATTQSTIWSNNESN